MVTQGRTGVTGRVSRRGETDYTLLRFLAWVFTLIGFEMLASAIGMHTDPWVGLLLSGLVLVGWSLISIALVSGKK